MSAGFITILFFIAIAVTSIAVLLGILIYDRQKNNKLSTVSKDDWLFNNFQKMVYNLFFKKTTADSICGINVKEYNRYCQILHQKVDFENLVALRIEGVVIFLLCGIIAYVMLNSMIFACIILCIGVAVLMILWEVPYRNLKSRAESKLYQIQNDMPRFLSLMEKAMDLPIDQAMLITAEKFDSPLSDDILDSIHKVTLGAEGWQTTLSDLAKCYDIKPFSDLVLEIINAYDQGVDIRDLVNRKVYEVEQDRMYAVEAHDSQIKTLIFLPIIALKIVPLMALIVLPMLSMYF